MALCICFNVFYFLWKKSQIVFIVFYFIDAEPVEVWRTLENLGMTTLYG